MAASVKVVLDIPALTHFKSWNGPLGHSIRRLARETVWRQKTLAPRRTGTMMGSIEARYGGNPKGKGIWFEAGSWTVKYTLFMEEGTRPHKIQAKKAPALVFFWPKVGKVAHFKSVNHPGTRPYNFLKRGLEGAMNQWERGG